MNTHREMQQRPALVAVPTSETGATAGTRAAARARTAEETQQQPQPRPQRPIVTPRDTQQETVQSRLRRWITPPNPRMTAAPSWEQIKECGDAGRHAPPNGWPRTVSVLWSRDVALPARALAIWLDWVARSPSRFLVVLVLYALVAHLPGMDWLPWIF